MSEVAAGPQLDLGRWDRWVAREDQLAAKVANRKKGRSRAVVAPERCRGSPHGAAGKAWEVQGPAGEDSGPHDGRPRTPARVHVKSRRGRTQGCVNVPSFEHERAVGRQRQEARVIDAVKHRVVDDVVDREDDAHWIKLGWKLAWRPRIRGGSTANHQQRQDNERPDRPTSTRSTASL